MFPAMIEDLQKLGEREKETLRLLLAGHDAKSIANSLQISIHTVNERLREARRKLGVTSSREAARLLNQAERSDPQFHAGKQIGDAPAQLTVEVGQKRAGASRLAKRPLVWVFGGITVMSLTFAALMLSGVLQTGAQNSAIPASAMSTPADSEKAKLEADARQWVAIVDGHHWQDSWNTAGSYFKSQITAAQWQAKVEPVRGPLGAVTSRTLKAVMFVTDVPNAPRGNYAIVSFRTRFASGGKNVEIVVLAQEKSGWFVAGYWVLPDIE
jgi:DNA-binding CsgD family transcriptional regulator